MTAARESIEVPDCEPGELLILARSGKLTERMAVIVCESTPSLSGGAAIDGYVVAGHGHSREHVILWISGDPGCHRVARVEREGQPAAVWLVTDLVTARNVRLRG